MKNALLWVLLLLLFSNYAMADTTEGGNVTFQTVNATGRTLFWSAIVGWLDPLAPSDSLYPISNQSTPDNVVYTNYPNGTYYGI